MKRAMLATVFLIAGSVLASAADPLLEAALSAADPEAAPALEKRFAAEGGARAGLYAGLMAHSLALANPEWIEKASAALEAAWKETGDPIALAYWGSATTLRGGRASGKGDILAASRDVQAGFDRMDEAVSRAPGEPLVRFLRASNLLSVADKSPFKRYGVVAEDLGALRPSLDAFAPDSRALWWLLTGRLAQAEGRPDAAARAYENALRSAPSSASARQARALLRRLEE